MNKPKLARHFAVSTYQMNKTKKKRKFRTPPSDHAIKGIRDSDYPNMGCLKESYIGGWVNQEINLDDQTAFSSCTRTAAHLEQFPMKKKMRSYNFYGVRGF